MNELEIQVEIGPDGTDGGERAMKAEPKPTHRFFVCCPHCGDEGRILVDLNDLDEVYCQECSWLGTPAMAVEKARENAEKWERIARWLASAGDVL